MLAEARSDIWSELLVKVGAGRDREAFGELFAHFAPLLKGFLMKGSSLGPERAEELVQETMIKVWRKADSFNATKSSASTWIYTVARNCRIDWLRREAKSSRDIEAEDIYESSEENTSYTSLVQIRNRDLIRENLALLPPEQLEVIAKIYFEGKSHSEVAAELTLPLGTVKSRIRLALNRLQLRMTAEENTPDV
ncbi:MAG: sigma-70 family RNA polymerase sigma factor [Pseudomonadales bacterium]|nr:sigma-70 family RNA polymerase sigma factor [Pseudomonadales bacterium]MDP4875878.1 sigma-70 family RNA polymerase sigma factor [Pseudomonadales bacterium]